MGCLDDNGVLDLLGGKLTPPALREADAHLATCSECRALLFELRDGSDAPSSEGSSSVWLEALGLERTGRLASRAPVLAAGLSIGERYVLEERIGEGGMGVVWAARHASSGERFALKFLKAVGKERSLRMIREARIAASLRHPGIVQVVDVLTYPDASTPGKVNEDADASPVIVMELLVGESLAKRLRTQKRLELPEVVSIIGPVVDALASVHAAGVVHRDLKPENVFLVASPGSSATSVKVLDFGLAKRTRFERTDTSSGSGLTRTGAMVGTPHYMAPEQIFGEKTVDGRADIWALGVVLYECLAGTRPIGGDNFGQVIKNITMGSITPLDSLVAVPPEVSALIHAMLSRVPDDRPSSPKCRRFFDSRLERRHKGPRHLRSWSKARPSPFR